MAGGDGALGRDAAGWREQSVGAVTRVIDRFIPDAADLDSDELRRRRTFVVTSSVLVPSAFLFAWLTLDSGGVTTGFVGLLASGLVGGANLLVTPRVPALARYASHVLLFDFLFIMGFLPATSPEGIWNTALWYLPIVPLVAAFLLSMRWAVSATAISVSFLTWLYAQASAQPHLGPDATFFRWMALSVVLLTITAIAWAYGLAWREAERRIAATLEDLQAANDRLEDLNRALDDSRAMTERDNQDKTSFITTMRENARAQGGALDDTSAAMAQMAATFRTVGESVGSLEQSASQSKDAVRGVHVQAEQVAVQSSQLASSVKEAAGSIEEMTFSVREVANNVEDLTAITEETASAMLQMQANIAQVDANASSTEHLAERVIQDASRGTDAVSHTREGIQNILEVSRQSSSTIRSLGERTQQIDTILDVIGDVAEQTQLLSLNAAIIASQAGVHGRGFSVVASEIKKLAERTATSTKEIAAVIQGVQEEVSCAVENITAGERVVADGLTRSREAEAALDEILRSAEETTRMVKAIAGATTQQTEGAKQVTRAMERVAQGASLIKAATSEQAAGAEILLDSSVQMERLADNVARSSLQQREDAQRIDNAVARIYEMVRQIQHAQEEQTRGSDQILRSIEAIHDGQVAQVDSIEHLDASRLPESVDE
jgi:methyl-accepting chemotaxis protein